MMAETEETLPDGCVLECVDHEVGDLFFVRTPGDGFVQEDGSEFDGGWPFHSEEEARAAWAVYAGRGTEVPHA